MRGSGMPPVAILAGGLATRLRPVTEAIPKALVIVAGKPFLHHQILLLKSRGIRDIVLCVGYLGEMIQREFGDGRHLGVDLRYSFDGKRLLGTAGALRRALPLLGEAFFTLYGDSYLRCDYGAVASAFYDSRKLGLMTVFRNEGKYEASNVEYASGRILRYSKKSRTASMQHIDYGLGIFRKRVFAELPEGQICDLADVFQNLLEAGELAAFETNERFYEIGSFAGLSETTDLLALHGSPGGATTIC